MSKTLTFHNPGEIDIRGATIAGLSAKANADSAIGFFGTGMKYAIACVLRWGGTFVVYSGTDCYTFSAEDLEFRGASFKQVMMTGPLGTVPQPLGFTTEYGKKWVAWQVFRELYANALDEGGDVTPTAIAPAPSTTLVVVTCPKLLEPYTDRDDIILPAACVYTETTSDAFIMDRPASTIFYRGVRVASIKSLLTWNFRKDFDLTEDRTLNGSWQATHRAGKVAQSLTDSGLIHKIINAPKGMFEAELPFNSWHNTSPEFIAAAERAYKLAPNKHGRLVEILKEHRPEVLEPTPLTISPMRQRMLDRAITFARRMGMNPDSYPITVADLGGSILGSYNHATGKIMLSPTVFEQGTKQVLSTLYEELVHAETGKEDCNYDMQTWLFNQIISLHEEHVFGEPV